MMTHKDPVALTSRPLDKLRVSAATIHIFFIHRRFQFIQYVHGNAGDVAAYFFVDQLSSCAFVDIIGVKLPGVAGCGWLIAYAGARLVFDRREQAFPPHLSGHAYANL
jgi:hypothetical protein